MKSLILLAIVICVASAQATQVEEIVNNPAVAEGKVMTWYFNLRANIDWYLGWVFYYLFCKYYVPKQFTAYSSAFAKEACLDSFYEEILKNWTT